MFSRQTAEDTIPETGFGTTLKASVLSACTGRWKITKYDIENMGLTFNIYLKENGASIHFYFISLPHAAAEKLSSYFCPLQFCRQKMMSCMLF